MSSGIKLVFFALLIHTISVHGEPTYLTGTEGSNITLPDKVMESGTLSWGGVARLVVSNRMIADRLDNRLLWNNSTGEITITDLGKDDTRELILNIRNRSPVIYSLTVHAHSGLNLKGKMFTLARFSSGVTLYHPSFSISSLSSTPKTHLKRRRRPNNTSTHGPYTTPSYTTPSYTTPSYTTPSYRPPSYPPWTTAAPTRGVSVCLRFMIEYLEDTRPTIFTLSPSSTFLTLGVNYPTSYEVKYYPSTVVKLRPNFRLWPGIPQSSWISVCVTIDSKKRVVQLFEGPLMSIRKVMPSQYDWSGEPVMQFSGSAGQVKDVQVWNYPLHYNDIYNYMIDSSYGSKQGNILSWSHISYSVQGQSFLEDSY